MPEGHTVHRIARDHHDWFAGQQMIVASPQGRFSREAKKLSGKTLESVEAHGKHLFYRFAGSSRRSALLMHVHLGLYGKFRKHRNPPPEPRGAVRVRMIGHDRAFDLNGPNQCELLNKTSHGKLLKRLGQDPLRDDADPEKAWQRISSSRASIGNLLLNQSVIAGIGNIYRAEILHLEGIHPERQGRELTREEFDRLWSTTCRLLSVGLKYNRIITVDRSDVDKPLSRLRSDERLLCYKKTQCPDCGQRIRKWDLGNRTMYACDRCQA